MNKLKILFFMCAMAVFAMSCTKLETTPQFLASTTATTVTASGTTYAVTAADSASTAKALTFTWTDPKYAVGLAQSKFSIVVGASGKNFVSFSNKDFTGVLTGSLLGKEINAMALKFGGVIGTPINLDVKVVSSQANNNETKSSNVLTIAVTPYGDLALTASASSVVTTAANASSVGDTFTWNIGFTGYEGTITYQFQYANGGTNFASPTLIAATSRSQSFTQLDLNNIAALSYGVLAGSVGNIDFRVKATNAAGSVIYSNTVTVAVTPYSSKPVPKYPVPDSLYIVGSATVGGWSNPVPLQSQHLTRIDDNTFGAIIKFSGGTDYTNGNNQYLLLPKNGDWNHKYSVNVSTTSANAISDSFAPDAPNNLPGPTTAGWYKIIVDFVKGTYSLTLLTSNPVPSNLYIVGDATAGAWSNPVPVPSQQFKQISNAEFQLSISLTTGKSYLLLPVNGDWGHKFGGSNATGGDLLVDSAVPSSNTPAPTISGNYIIKVNFITMNYKLTQ